CLLRRCRVVAPAGCRTGSRGSPSGEPTVAPPRHPLSYSCTFGPAERVARRPAPLRRWLFFGSGVAADRQSAGVAPDREQLGLVGVAEAIEAIEVPHLLHDLAGHLQQLTPSRAARLLGRRLPHREV